VAPVDLRKLRWNIDSELGDFDAFVSAIVARYFAE
jgi:hypothetical protein